MDEGKVRSALEIAMEKMARIPTLTPEEKVRQREEECAPRGRALAAKYLQGALREADLGLELRKYQGPEPAIVRKALIEALCQAVELDDAGRSDKAIEGIRSLHRTADLEGIRREAQEVAAGFGREREQRLAELEDTARARLESLGIAGSAVKPNAEARDAGEQEKELRLAFRDRIEGIRERLRSVIPDLRCE